MNKNSPRMRERSFRAEVEARLRARQAVKLPDVMSATDALACRFVAFTRFAVLPATSDVERRVRKDWQRGTCQACGGCWMATEA